MSATTAPSYRRRAEQLLTAEGTRLWLIAAYAAVALGCALRILRWVDNPALWLDEAFLSINLIDKPLGDLLGPLHFLQSAPPGFLLIEKGAETIIGDSEQSLRLFPLVASLASVFLFAYVARRTLAAPAATLAIVLFAAGEPLLERAAEVKPYSVDIAAATLIAALTVWALNAPAGRILGRTGVLGIVGIITLWLSFPAVFSLAAAVAAVVIFAWEVRSRRVFVAAVTVAAVWLATFGAVFAIASSNLSLVSAAIFTGADESAVNRLDTVDDAWSLFVNPGGFDNGTNALAALLAAFGVVALARRGTLHWLALFTLPLVAAGIADAGDRYPLGGRFSLFLAPFLLVLVARGAQALVTWSRRPLLVATGIGVFLAASPLAVGAYHTARPPARQDMKPLLDALANGWRDGDALYVYRNSQYALRFYSTCSDCRPSGKDFPWPVRVAPPSSSPGEQFAPALDSVPPSVIVGEGTSPIPPTDVSRIPRSGRIWLLFSHVVSHNGLDDEQLLLQALERDGELLEEVRARGARLYLVQRGTSE